MDRFLDPFRRMMQGRTEKEDPLARPEKLFNEITNRFHEVKLAGIALHDSRPDKETQDALMREFLTLNDMHTVLVEKPTADRRAPENDRANALHAYVREAAAFKQDLAAHREAIFAILGIPKTTDTIRPFYNPALYDKDKELKAYLSKLEVLRQALNSFHISYKAVYPAPLSQYNSDNSSES